MKDTPANAGKRVLASSSAKSSRARNTSRKTATARSRRSSCCSSPRAVVHSTSEAGLGRVVVLFVESCARRRSSRAFVPILMGIEPHNAHSSKKASGATFCRNFSASNRRRKRKKTIPPSARARVRDRRRRLVSFSWYLWRPAHALHPQLVRLAQRPEFPHTRRVM